MAKGKSKQKVQEQETRTVVDKVKDYFVSLKYEWFKITFPSRKELVQSTIVVFLFTIALMLVISLYDILVAFVLDRWIIPPSAAI